jgi:hypothetical protein
MSLNKLDRPVLSFLLSAENVSWQEKAFTLTFVKDTTTALRRILLLTNLPVSSR